MIFDLHCHTTASPDGHDDIFTLVSHAVELGIDMLAITEHCDAMEKIPFPSFWGECYQLCTYYETTHESIFSRQKRLSKAK